MADEQNNSIYGSLGFTPWRHYVKTAHMVMGILRNMRTIKITKQHGSDDAFNQLVSSMPILH
jgi:hypothetical protein